MKKTLHYKGHRWTDDELKKLMAMWSGEESVETIASALSASRSSILKMVVKLRQNGIPLKRRTSGNVAGRHSQNWTQGEVEYLVRRREERSTCEEIAYDLGRSWSAVNGMIQKLRKENVPIAMRGHGVRRLWNADSLKIVSMQSSDASVISSQNL